MTRKSALGLSTVETDSDAGWTTVVSASGTLDIATADQFEGEVTAALGNGRPLLVDVSELAFCDSTGLGAIVRLHRLATTRDQEFRIRDPRPHIADLLAMTGIDKVIPVVTSR